MDANKITPPELEKMPEPCSICDLMISLGLSNSICQTLPPGEKNKCLQIIKPLEDKKATAVDTLANLLVELGEDKMNDALDRFNTLVWQATVQAKDIMIRSGKLNQDGTPKE